MKTSIKSPEDSLRRARDNLTRATDAHLAGDADSARRLFIKADCDEVWDWLHPAWYIPVRNVKSMVVPGDTMKVPKADRDPDRNIAAAIKRAVLARDGHHCRYCGIEVVAAEIRNIIFRLYPEVRSTRDRPHRNHAAFDALWLQYDHVVPHCHGGRSSAENIVISCGLCNFGKDQYTLAQLDLLDPRDRSPIRSGWDGLERLRGMGAVPSKQPRTLSDAAANGPKDGSKGPRSKPLAGGNEKVAVFLPGAWQSKGYAYYRDAKQKERWFKLCDQTTAIPWACQGVLGQIVYASPLAFDKRQIAWQEMAFHRSALTP